MGTFIFFIAIAVVAVVVLVYSHRAERRRQDDLRRVARTLGFSFEPAKDRNFHTRYGHDLFDRGSDRVAWNTLRGELDVDGDTCKVTMGDYRYTTGSGDSKQTHRVSYALLDTPFVGMPRLLIRAEHLGDRLAASIGFDDIDFESEEFSRKFFVKSADKKFAYALVHPRMMEFLLSRTAPTIELEGDVVLITTGGYGTTDEFGGASILLGQRWTPQEFSIWLAWARRFVSLWPEHVRERHRRSKRQAV